MNTVWLKCTVKRGAFSGERGVLVENCYESVLPVGYLRKNDGSCLNTEEPQDEEMIGQVSAQVIAKEQTEMTLVFPDGERKPITKDALQQLKVQ